MARIPEPIRRNIAANIRAERKRKFPGRGGARKCADAFGVPPQQWTAWEKGVRTPSEATLRRLAKFLGRPFEQFLRDTTDTNLAYAGNPREGEPIPLACRESAVLWSLDKVYTGVLPNGNQFHLALNMVLSQVTTE